MPYDGEIRNNRLSNPAKILAAYMRCSGISDAKQLAADLDIPLRTIQRLKLECATSANDASCAISGAPSTPLTPDMAAPVAPNAPDVALADTPLARANKELPSEVVISKNQQQQPERIVVDANQLYEKLASAAGIALSQMALGLQVCSEPQGWLNGGADLDRDVIPVVAALSKAAKPQSINSWKYYRNAVIRARDARLSGLPAPVISKSAEVVPFKLTTAVNLKPRLDPMEAANA
jgi:hypothetical protein